LIVVDTNILVYWVLPSPHSAVLAELVSADPFWKAPALWRSELRNVLVGCMRRGEISLDRAYEGMQAAETRMGGGGEIVSSEAVLRLAAGCRCTAYDLEFVALAQQLAVPLVTMDRELLAAFPDVARPLLG